MNVLFRPVLPSAGAAVILSALIAPSVAAPQTSWTTERARSVTQLLEQHAAENPVPGFSAVVVADGRIVFSRGYGVEVLGESAPVTDRSPIGIGSQTKSFTALAVMQLVEQDLVELDAPVKAYLPWFRTADGRGDEITVRMLLHNTSGIPSQDRWLTSSDRSEAAAERTVRQLSSVSLTRPPGSSFEYSNENWTILGEIVSKISGLAYSTYMQERVFDPLGLDDTTTALELFDDKQVLYGHYTGIDEHRPARPRFLAEALAAGSEMRSSARDMGRFLLLLLDRGTLDGRRFLQPETVDQLFEAGIRTKMYMPEMGIDGEVAGYGMGWVEAEIDGRTIHHHGGNAIVMTSWTMVDREAGVAASVLYNGPGLDSYRYPSKVWLTHNLLRLARGEPLSRFGNPSETDPLANDYQLPTDLLARYAGDYVSRSGLRATVTLDDDEPRLVVSMRTLDLDYVYEVDFANETSIVLRNLAGGAAGRFLMTPDGEVTGFEGGVFGGPYRRLDPQRGAGRQTVTTERLSLALPSGWQWSPAAAGGRALSPEGEVSLSVSFRDDEAASALTAEPDDRETGAQRTETIGPWVWRQRIVNGQDGRSRLVASTPVGRDVFEITLDSPTVELTTQVRSVLLPLFESLNVQPADL